MVQPHSKYGGIHEGDEGVGAEGGAAKPLSNCVVGSVYIEFKAFPVPNLKFWGTLEQQMHVVFTWAWARAAFRGG